MGQPQNKVLININLKFTCFVDQIVNPDSTILVYDFSFLTA